MKPKEVQGAIKKLVDMGLTKEDIASKLGISAMSVYRYLRGTARPKSAFIIRGITVLLKKFT